MYSLISEVYNFNRILINKKILFKNSYDIIDFDIKEYDNLQNKLVITYNYLNDDINYIIKIYEFFNHFFLF